MKFTSSYQFVPKLFSFPVGQSLTMQSYREITVLNITITQILEVFVYINVQHYGTNDV